MYESFPTTNKKRCISFSLNKKKKEEQENLKTEDKCQFAPELVYRKQFKVLFHEALLDKVASQSFL